MNCEQCEHMKIVPIDGDYKYGTAAKCFKHSKKGKVITWAMSTYSPSQNKIIENAVDRIKTELGRKKESPFWCK